MHIAADGETDKLQPCSSHTYKLVETPLFALAGDVEHHIAGEDRIGNVEDLALEAADGGAIPSHVDHNALHCLQHRT